MLMKGFTGEASDIMDDAQSAARLRRREGKQAEVEGLHVFQQLIYKSTSPGGRFLEDFLTTAAVADNSHTLPPHTQPMLTRTVVEINGKKFEVPLPQKAVQARIKTINDLLLIEIDRVFNDKKATRPDGPPPRFTPNLLPRIQEVRAARAMPEVSSLVILEAILDSGAVRDLLVKLGTSYEELGVVLDTHWKLPSFHPAVAEGAPKPSGS